MAFDKVGSSSMLYHQWIKLGSDTTCYLWLSECEEIVMEGKSRINCWEKKITEKQRDNIIAKDPISIFNSIGIFK